MIVEIALCVGDVALVVLDAHLKNADIAVHTNAGVVSLTGDIKPS